MNIIKRICFFGDSILKGIQLNPVNQRYQVENHIESEILNQNKSMVITNYSSFGCTVGKGDILLQKRLKKDELCDMIVMDYGGNDCDFNWKEISDNPNMNHDPHTPLNIFESTYKKIIHTLKDKGILPVLTTLPPLEPQKFFNWFCKDLNKCNILNWLGSINSIYRFQENYSRTVEKIAFDTNTNIVDLRGAFLANRRIDDLLCEDGTHPTSAGQKIIADAFLKFTEEMIAS